MTHHPRRVYASPPRANRRTRLSTIAAVLLLTLGLFTTASTPVAQALGILPDSKPKVSVVKDRRSVNLGVKFSSSRNGEIVALQFYRSSKQKKAYVGSLWSAKGKLLARVTFPKSSKQGWQTAKLSKPVAIKKGTTYVASYLASDGRFAVTRGGFSKKRVKNGITVPKSGGVFKYSKKSKRPTSSNRSNYLVDVVFEPSPTVKPTPTPTASPKPSASPTPTASPKPSTSPTPTASPKPTLTPSASPTPRPTTTPTPTPTRSSTPPATGPLTTAQVEQARDARVFFAHQSVGGNVLRGIDDLRSQHKVADPPTVDLDDEQISAIPATGPVLVDVHVGENGDPMGKIEAFASYLRSGVGDRVDVAVLKFCYADIRGATLTGGYSVTELFNAYRDTMAQLKQEYPNVTFLHATAPVENAGMKPSAPIAEYNANRAQYNALIRAAYGDSGLLWDIAKAESTDTNGARVTTTYGGQSHDALYEPYSTDGGHLNEDGRKVAAAPLIQLIAQHS